MEKLPAESNPEAEKSLITPEQLRSESLLLRLGIRTQVGKALSNHRQRLQVWADKMRPLKLSSDDYIDKMAQNMKIPTDVELRERLRHSQRVWVGTEKRDGHMYRHSYEVYEDEEFARYPNKHPETRLVILHVAEKINQLEELISAPPDTFEKSRDETLLCTIDIVGDAINPHQGARRLEPEELALPFDIIDQARKLYPSVANKMIE